MSPDPLDLQNPPPRDVTLWMLNDRLEPEELRRQLRAFKETGWARVITRTYNGLRTPYMSTEWFDCLDCILDEAAKLDMKVWLQAGYMPNAIPNLPAVHHSRVLRALEEGEQIEEEDELLAQAGELRIVSRRRDNVLDLTSPEAIEFYLQQAYEGAYVQRYGHLFGSVVEAIWVDEPALSADQPAWGQAVLETFHRKWGTDPTEHVGSLFRRQGPWRKFRHHYWTAMIDVLGQGYFTKISDWCNRHALLFTGHLMGEDTLKVQTSRTAACMPLYAKMGIPGIDHLTEDLHWWHGKEVESDQASPRFVQTPVQCASAAAQNGQTDVLSEMYGVASAGLSFEDRKRIGEWFAILGINIRCLHGSFYSLRGRRKRIYPPSMNVHQPWWSENDMVAGHFTRLQNALTEGRYVAEVLVVHPIETAHTLYEPKPDARSMEEIGRLNLHFARLSEALLATRRGFHYADEAMLAQIGGVHENRFRVGQMDYPVLCLCGNQSLRASTADLIEQFLDAGGKILLVGQGPTMIDADPSCRAEAIANRCTPVEANASALDQALGAWDPDRIQVQTPESGGGNLLLHERVLDDGRRVALLLNAQSESLGPVKVSPGPEAGKLYQVDLACGERISLPGPEASLEFEPWQSRLLLVGRKGRGEDKSASVTLPTGRSLELQGPWELVKCTPNAMVLDFARLQMGDQAPGPKIPVTAIQQILQEEQPGGSYRGPIALEFDVDVDAAPSGAQLLLEDAPAWQVEVNGQPLEGKLPGHYWDRSFECVDLEDTLVSGENRIRISRRFEPLEKAQGLMRLFANLGGSEIEPAAIVGDFAVATETSSRPQQERCRRIAGPGRIIAKPEQLRGEDLISEGFAFFCGRLTLARKINIPDDAHLAGAILELPQLDACTAVVTLNGRQAGRIAWTPRRLAIGQYLQPGENDLRIELISSLRNLMGPLHRPQGEARECWGFAAFFGRFDRKTGRGYPQWWLPENRREDTLAWTDDYLLRKFGLGSGARILLGN